MKKKNHSTIRHLVDMLTFSQLCRWNALYEAVQLIAEFARQKKIPFETLITQAHITKHLISYIDQRQECFLQSRFNEN